jgi:copper(I)-binding protein
MIAATDGSRPVPESDRRSLPRDLVRGAAGPVICVVILTALLSAWVSTGGAGTITQVRLQVSLAAVPMRAFTPQEAAAAGAATTYLIIHNLSGTADELIAVRSPLARHVVLTKRDGPTSPRTVVADLRVPPHGTLSLSPFGDDVILQHPSPFETLATVPLILTFRHAGTVTIQAPVTPPDTP